MIIIVCGLPGTGKTTIAKRMVKEINGRYLNTDDIRLKLYPSGRTYSQEEKDSVYREMFRIAEEETGKGHNVIMDGTFYLKKYRKWAEEKFGKNLVFVECVLDEEKVRERIEERNRKKYSNDPEGRNEKSEADFRVYKIVKNQYEEFDEEEKEKFKIIRTDCTAEGDRIIEEVRKMLKKD